jgi:hypothetical protein
MDVHITRVTVTANDAGMGNVTGSGDYAANSAVTISATPLSCENGKRKLYGKNNTKIN